MMGCVGSVVSLCLFILVLRRDFVMVSVELPIIEKSLHLSHSKRYKFRLSGYKKLMVRSMKELKKELEFVRSNVYSLYEWVCSMEDTVLRLKKVLQKMKKSVRMK